VVHTLTYLQAVVIGIVQGIAEMFPVSSLGHTVLIPALIGGSWGRLVTQESTQESPYLAFVVGLHLANAVALLVYYRATWVRIIAAFFRSLGRRRVDTPDERLAWLVVIATIPVGLLGLLLEHPFRVLFAKPLAAAAFLFLNGLILLAGERQHRRMLARARVEDPEAAHEMEFDESRADVAMDAQARRSLSRLSVRTAAVVGLLQSTALLAGISREGVTMVAGMTRGLNREDALRFAYLLSTPVIFAAGILKVPDLTGQLGNGIRGQVAVGGVVAVVVSLIALRVLLRYFRTRTLTPFAVYCLLMGGACLVRFGLF
jgi:undecaprenyl-diphosphatase